MNIENDLRNFFKQWPRFYTIMVKIFSPIFFGGLSPQAFLKSYGNGRTVNVGSGPQKLGPNIINVDILPFPGVDVVANIKTLPFENETIDRVVCDNVLEHVDEPVQAVAELYRILKPGGYLYICTPFLYPFHASPHDYTRWTLPGLRVLCQNFVVIEEGVRSAFFSTLCTYLCYACATLISFGNKTLYWLLVNIFTFIFFPIKFLDFFLGWLPRSSNLAAAVYVVVKKN